MPRPKGSGAIKQINAAKHDAVTIRRSLHSGGEPVNDSDAQLFTAWRNVCVQRDDCAQRLKAGNGTKWTRTRLKQLEREAAAIWAKLGTLLSAVDSPKLSGRLLVLSRVARPPIYAWQAEATRLIEAAWMTEKTSDDKVLSLAGQKVNLSASELVAALRANGYQVNVNDGAALHDLRRFVRTRLRVTLRNERGKRNDLGH